MAANDYNGNVEHTADILTFLTELTQFVAVAT